MKIKHKLKKTKYNKSNKAPEYLTYHDTGYHVRIGKEVSLFFGISMYGSNTKALTEALAYRDQVLELLAPAKRHYNGNLRSSRNNTGHIGISFYDDAYIAQWLEKGTRKKKHFSVNKYGKDRAFSLALAEREKAVGMFPKEVLNQIVELTNRVKESRKIKAIV